MEVRSGRPGRGRSTANGRDLAFQHIALAPVGPAAGRPCGAQHACGIYQELKAVASAHVLATKHREYRRKLDIVGAAGGSGRHVREWDHDGDDVALVRRQLRTRAVELRPARTRCPMRPRRRSRDTVEPSGHVAEKSGAR